MICGEAAHSDTSSVTSPTEKCCSRGGRTRLTAFNVRLIILETAFVSPREITFSDPNQRLLQYPASSLKRYAFLWQQSSYKIATLRYLKVQSSRSNRKYMERFPLHVPGLATAGRCFTTVRNTRSTRGSARFLGLQHLLLVKNMYFHTTSFPVLPKTWKRCSGKDLNIF